MIHDREETILSEQAREDHLERGPGRRASSGSCSCPYCGLYRWYPPLLVASTLLSAAFCALYLTKPVIKMAPASGREPAAIERGSDLPLLEAGLPESGDQIVDVSDDALDPMQEGLPGDAAGGRSVGMPEPLDGGGALVETAGMKRLEIAKPTRSLFKPAPSPAEPEMESVVPEPIKTQHAGTPLAGELVFGPEAPAVSQGALLAAPYVQPVGPQDGFGPRLIFGPLPRRPLGLMELESGGGWTLGEKCSAPVETETSIVGEFYPAVVPAKGPNPDESAVGSSSEEYFRLQ